MRCPAFLALTTILVAAAACATGTTDDVTGDQTGLPTDAGSSDAQHKKDAATTPPPPPPPPAPTDDASTPPPADDASTPPPDMDSSTPPQDDSGNPPPPPPVDAAPPPGPFCDTSNSSNAARYITEYGFAQASGTLTNCDPQTGAGCGALNCCYVPIVGSPGCVIQ